MLALSRSAFSDSLWPFCPCIFPASILEQAAVFYSRKSSWPSDQTHVSCIGMQILSGPWNSPGQNTGVGIRFLLQGIFPTQGSNPGLLNCRQILYQLSHQGSPPNQRPLGIQCSLRPATINYLSELHRCATLFSFWSWDRNWCIWWTNLTWLWISLHCFSQAPFLLAFIWTYLILSISVHYLRSFRGLSRI